MDQAYLANSFYGTFLGEWNDQYVANRWYHFLRVCAIFDHYGYKVPDPEDWEDLTWYSLPLVFSHLEALQEEDSQHGSDPEDAIHGTPIAEASRTNTRATGRMPPNAANSEALTVGLYGGVLWPTPSQDQGHPTSAPPSTSRSASAGQLLHRPAGFKVPESRGGPGIRALHVMSSCGHGRPMSASSSTQDSAPSVGEQSAQCSSAQPAARASVYSEPSEHPELMRLLALYEDDSD